MLQKLFQGSGQLIRAAGAAALAVKMSRKGFGQGTPMNENKGSIDGYYQRGNNPSEFFHLFRIICQRGAKLSIFPEFLWKDYVNEKWFSAPSARLSVS